MIIKVGRFKFKGEKGKGSKKLCPLSLEEIKENYEPMLPKGRILVKKPDYALLKVARNEAVIPRLLRLVRNRDKAKSFILMYVRGTLVGYKSRNSTNFLPFFKHKQYMDVLREYVPRN